MGKKITKSNAGVNNSANTATGTPAETETNNTAGTAISEVIDNGQEVNTNEWLMEKLAPYFDAYPNEKLFYITSDGQVFLEKSHNDAVNHQRHYDKTKEVISFEVE